MNRALIIIDVQKAFDDQSWGRRNNLNAEENIAKLLTHWRECKQLVIHIQHISQQNRDSLFYFEKESSHFKEEVQPLDGEIIVQKNVNSAFIGTMLENILRETGTTDVVIVGLTTNHCVETTTRMAGNLGFNTYLVSDATATFDRLGPDGQLYKAEDIQRMTLANLHEEFATIIDTESLLRL
ncbi:cysteine hydrolase family protein [Ammoniphilus sp. CFH 90114]|uniref:cysteine hydrolase family protein n=1 Tax=Ammoniphilus sp. CFH 90114 TaxID=2493665 RepID=UPI00100E7D44|nr:cysteine hydrolase family protein [Ammoniphilus sp. CFH 90114]RXT06380.1 cysteine hydrolase [Ammoniphilus sp. CFH 90114]